MEAPKCKHLLPFAEAQLRIINKHLGDHKWFQHIENENKAVADFIDKFGWVMREFFCGYCCEHRFDCGIAKEYGFLPEEKKRKKKKE